MTTSQRVLPIREQLVAAYVALRNISHVPSQPSLIPCKVCVYALIIIAPGDWSVTLYEKYGGFKTVSRVVMSFYEMALESDQIGDHFEDIDMGRLIDHQTKFVSSLLGGPASFGDDRLHQVHAHLKISNADFDEMAALLAEALEEHGMSKPDVNQAVAAVEAKRAIIVTKQAA